jgi:hypothetical protein
MPLLFESTMHINSILKVRNTTPNVIVYGELGRFPLEIRVKLRMISYWCKLVNNETKLNLIKVLVQS